MRHDHIVAAARNTRAFSNSALARLEIRRAPLESDPPEHGQIRRLLSPLFTPRALAAREALTRAIADEYVAAFVADGGGDAIAGIARPVPTQVLLGWLGAPPKDWMPIKAWADASRPQQVPDDATRDRIATAERALWDYSWALIRDRQASPRDTATDPVSAMLSGTLDGAPMPEEMAVGMVRLALAAGHDSTSQAVGIMLHFLAVRGDVQAMLRADRSLIAPAIEETLRLNSPVVAMPRTLVADVELGGRTLRKGERVLLNYASANRDPAAFDKADEWQLGRSTNRNMVFGHGIHSCVGAPLARQEITAVVSAMFDQCTHFRLAGEPGLQPMQQFGYATLPLDCR
jgi:cytochrome P450